MKNQLKPDIRFSGFTYAWEQKRYMDIGKNLQGGNLAYKDLNKNGKYKAVLYGDLYTKYDTIINGIKRRTNQTSLTIIKNDILFPQSTTVDAISLISPACLNEKTAETSGVFVIRPNNDVDGNFVSYYSKGNNAQRYKLSTKAQGLTIVHLYYNSIKNETIMMPTLNEQIKISLLFTNIDKYITLHQRKLDKIINIKKSLLEKMFPENGKNLPTVRFSGFTYAWEQCKLEDITYQYGEKNYNNLPLESYSVSNKYGFYNQIEQFKNGGIVRYADKSKSIIVTPNTFAYNPARIDIGSIGYQNLNKNVLISPMYSIFKTYQNIIDDKFLWHWLKSDIFNKIVLNSQEGGVRLVFNLPKFFNSSITMPDKSEQIKIGLLFDNIDKYITLHQRKLEKLKNIKKSLLEKMFC